jgi:cold shock CspA family protein
MPQGTIRSFSPETLEGTLLDDGLLERPFDAEAFRASGLQALRIGQRVRFELQDVPDRDEPRVSHLNVVSL